MMKFKTWILLGDYVVIIGFGHRQVSMLELPIPVVVMRLEVRGARSNNCLVVIVVEMLISSCAVFG